MQKNEIDLYVLGGLSLPVRISHPSTASSVVIMSGGYGIFGIGEPIQDKLVQFLTSHGIATVQYAYPERTEKFQIDDLSLTSGIYALQTVYNNVVRPKFTKIYLFGISFGGVISALFAHTHSVDGLILANTVVDYHDFRKKQLGEKSFAGWEERGWVEIKYPHRSVGLSRRFIQETRDLRIEKTIIELQCYVLMYQGMNDIYIDTTHLERITESKEKFHGVVVPGCEHPFTEPDAIDFFVNDISKNRHLMGW